MSADGIVTYWNQVNPSRRELYLSPYSKGLLGFHDYNDCNENDNPKHILASVTDSKFVPSENVVHVFDVWGSEVLNNSGKCSVIVIDELGFLESGAHIFQQAVMKRLAGEIPILGIVRAMQTEFLDTVRAHRNVVVLEVTAKNREEVLERLLCFDFGAPDEGIASG